MHVLTAMVCLSMAGVAAISAAHGALLDPRETRLSDVRQLTHGGENAEAYFSPDGTELIFQSTRPPYACDQIFRLRLAAPETPMLVSTGRGRTTCAYYAGGGERIIYSSTHAENAQCPAPPDRSRGYVWPLYESYDIYTAAADGSDLRPLTQAPGYDAEATVCPLDGSIVFTSTRDGDLELYRMQADGSNVQRLTETPGYDGGAFFSRDCKRIVWRASRPTGAELEDYRALLAAGLVRPGALELWVANTDGSDARQVTYLGGASFAPYFFPNGERIIFSSNHHDPAGREFDLWAVNTDGTGLERITHTPGFDGFPMFSPDGGELVFASNRNQAQPGDTDIYIARWRDDAPPKAARAADRYLADVAWLADDARGGRGLGTEGLEAAAEWLEASFRAIGLEPGAGDGYRQGFEATVAIEQGPSTTLSVGGEALPPSDFVVPGFSANGSVTGPIVFAGWGIDSEEHGIDDYAGLDVRGRIVLVRRYTPQDDRFASEELKSRFGSLRYKAFTAREHGAAALLIADLPASAQAAEPPLPELRPDPQGDAGIPVAVVKRRWAERMLSAAGEVAFTAALLERTRTVHNIVGRLPAVGTSGALPGSIVIGAHYDHLGLGGEGSLAPDAREPHNGADDNASGVAALLEAARVLAAQRDTLRRDVVLVAFTAEETGLLGSSRFTRVAPRGLAIDHVVAMLNLDMVGRMRGNRVSVLGSESAAEWDEIVSPLCAERGIACQLGGNGYGPSDQTPFYSAGVPVLHFFTGAHEDYHKPSDDWSKINAAGGAEIAALVANLTLALTQRESRLTYQAATAPAGHGDSRSYGASLGTLPDYAGPPGGKRGMLLAGVREGGPADRAGLARGDLIVELAGREVGDIYDLMYILRDLQPGQETTVVVERNDERIERSIVLGESTRR